MRGIERLIGRDEDANAVAELLAEHALVTIVGPGGLGKTSLAIALAADLADDHPGGSHVVELAGLAAGDDVAHAVARQLDIDTMESLHLRVAGRRTLIVLDNCESAIAGAAASAAALTSSGDIRVLATSRRPLRLDGERVYVLDPLPLPGVGPPREVPQAPAARLFIERSREHGATWEEDEANLAAVGRVVHRLDGLPLAIELAAARSRVLTPPELVTHLDRQLDVLARPGDDGRHSSLRRAIESSYAPMDEARQEQLRRLAAVPGPFDLALAHRVAPAGETELDTLDGLTALVDSSLVDARPGANGVTRYRLLDSIRAYAHEQLEASGDLAGVNEAFVDSMVEVADAILAAGMREFSTEVLARIRDRFSLLVAALNWTLDHDETAGRAYRLILPFYGPTGARSEVAGLARRVAARWDGDAPLKAEAMAVMGTVNFVAADYENGSRFATAAIEHPDASDLARLIGYRTLGMIAATEQDLAEAKRLFEEGLAIGADIVAFARELRISWAAVALDAEDRAGVIAQLEGLLSEARASDEAITIVWAASTMAVHRIAAGDLAAAERAADEARAAADRSGVPWAASTAARIAGSVAAVAHGWDRALPFFRQSLDVTVAGGDMEGMAMTLRSAAGSAAFTGNTEVARSLWSTIPLTQGIPVLRSPTHDLEMALQDELGRPAGTDLVSLSGRARALLEGDSPSPAGTSPASGVVYRFGDNELDVGRVELRVGGVAVHIEPQVHDVLLHLVENAGRVVTKHELMDEVWGDRFVSEAALSSRIAHARRAVGDDGKRQEVIKTVHGRGFMFVAEVTTT
ncbi:MAG: winged helix-turn-helix domain-containing protein [Acidimicrobiales bacterium]|nr:winged helix-turn-helix domain-containing protein [Acidimicrobiales bacterium]